MPASDPQFLLFTESLRHAGGARMWRFLLLELGSNRSVSASDIELGISTSRAELLALVRGLEAIDGRATIKLITGSGYINRGLQRGLTAWKNQGWHWERFGRRVEVRDADLWKRVDHALDFHDVNCVAWTNTHASFDKAAELSMNDAYEMQPELVAETAPQDEAVLIVRKPRKSRSQQIAATARQSLYGAKRRIQSLLEPQLAPSA